jgi:small neutral amino acid transporter SnatA (MarC family)
VRLKSLYLALTVELAVLVHSDKHLDYILCMYSLRYDYCRSMGGVLLACPAIETLFLASTIILPLAVCNTPQTNSTQS